MDNTASTENNLMNLDKLADVLNTVQRTEFLHFCQRKKDKDHSGCLNDTKKGGGGVEDNLKK